MVSWSTIQTIVVLVGPIVVPKAIGFVRSLRPKNGKPKPLTGRAKLCLNVLFAVIVIALASTMSYFQDENIVTIVGGRLLQTPNELLQTRLTAYRVQQGLNSLTPNDLKLLDIIKSREGRLLFATYGPKALVDCAWCSTADPLSYLYYSIPTMAVPHIFNVGVLGLVTSSTFSKDGSGFRTHATVAGLGLAIAEIVMLYRFDMLQNTRAFRPQDITWYHWRLQTYRGLAIAVVDFVIGIMIYLSATGRYGTETVTDAEKIESITKVMESTLANVRTGLFVKSTSVRDDSTLAGLTAFWKKEALTRTAIADEVQETRNQVLERINLDSMNDEAFRYTTAMMDALSNQPGILPGHGSAQ